MRYDFKLVGIEEVWFSKKDFDGEEFPPGIALVAKSDAGPSYITVTFYDKKRETLRNLEIPVDDKGVRVLISIPNRAHYLVLTNTDSSVVITGKLDV